MADFLRQFEEISHTQEVDIDNLEAYIETDESSVTTNQNLAANSLQIPPAPPSPPSNNYKPSSSSTSSSAPLHVSPISASTTDGTESTKKESSISENIQLNQEKEPAQQTALPSQTQQEFSLSPSSCISQSHSQSQVLMPVPEMSVSAESEPDRPFTSQIINDTVPGGNLDCNTPPRSANSGADVANDVIISSNASTVASVVVSLGTTSIDTSKDKPSQPGVSDTFSASRISQPSQDDTPSKVMKPEAENIPIHSHKATMNDEIVAVQKDDTANMSKVDSSIASATLDVKNAEFRSSQSDLFVDHDLRIDISKKSKLPQSLTSTTILTPVNSDRDIRRKFSLEESGSIEADPKYPCQQPRNEPQVDSQSSEPLTFDGSPESSISLKAATSSSCRKSKLDGSDSIASSDSNEPLINVEGIVQTSKTKTVHCDGGSGEIVSFNTPPSQRARVLSREENKEDTTITQEFHETSRNITIAPLYPDKTKHNGENPTLGTAEPKQREHKLKDLLRPGSQDLRTSSIVATASAKDTQNEEHITSNQENLHSSTVTTAVPEKINESQKSIDTIIDESSTSAKPNEMEVLAPDSDNENEHDVTFMHIEKGSNTLNFRNESHSIPDSNNHDKQGLSKKCVNEEHSLDNSKESQAALIIRSSSPNKLSEQFCPSLQGGESLPMNMGPLHQIPVAEVVSNNVNSCNATNEVSPNKDYSVHGQNRRKKRKLKLPHFRMHKVFNRSTPQKTRRTLHNFKVRNIMLDSNEDENMSKEYDDCASPIVEHSQELGCASLHMFENDIVPDSDGETNERDQDTNTVTNGECFTYKMTNNENKGSKNQSITRDRMFRESHESKSKSGSPLYLSVGLSDLPRKTQSLQHERKKIKVTTIETFSVTTEKIKIYEVDEQGYETCIQDLGTKEVERKSNGKKYKREDYSKETPPMIQKPATRMHNFEKGVLNYEGKIFNRALNDGKKNEVVRQSLDKGIDSSGSTNGQTDHVQNIDITDKVPEDQYFQEESGFISIRKPNGERNEESKSESKKIQIDEAVRKPLISSSIPDFPDPIMQQKKSLSPPGTIQIRQFKSSIGKICAEKDPEKSNCNLSPSNVERNPSRKKKLGFDKETNKHKGTSKSSNIPQKRKEMTTSFQDKTIKRPRRTTSVLLGDKKKKISDPPKNIHVRQDQSSSDFDRNTPTNDEFECIELIKATKWSDLPQGPVLAPYCGDGFLYPATVASKKSNGRFKVKYADGSGDLTVDRVYCVKNPLPP
eukprot:UC4_evm1s583